MNVFFIERAFFCVSVTVYNMIMSMCTPAPLSPLSVAISTFCYLWQHCPFSFQLTISITCTLISVECF